MEKLLERLTAAPCHRVTERPTLPQVPGVYLVRDNDVPIYVGQSRKLRNRLRHHTRPSSTRDQASFAFNLAKRAAEAAGVDIATPWSRALLEADTDFALDFAEARRSVAAMTVQFTQVDDPIVRSMLEICAALVLSTGEFNSFETH